jgi:hypothetical protein
MCSLSRRETKFRTLPALKVIVSAACDKITVSHIKHFKTGPRKIAAFFQFFLFHSSFTRFRLLYLSTLFERRHLAKPFKSHYSFVFWLISKSLNIHDSVSRPLLFFFSVDVLKLKKQRTGNVYVNCHGKTWRK